MHGVLAVCGLVLSTTARAASIVPFGDLPGGAVLGAPSSVSADGRLVLGQSVGADGRRAVVWTREAGLVPLAVPVRSEGWDVLSDGSVLVRHDASGDWYRGPASGPFERVDVPSDDIWITAWSGDGRVAAGVSDDLSHIVLWREGMGLSAVGFGETYPPPLARWALSADGDVIAAMISSQGTSGVEPYIWRESGGVRLGHLVPDTGLTWPLQLSSDGRVVVGLSRVAERDYHVFRWTAAGGMQDIGVFEPRAINTDGSIVVGRRNIGLATEAVVWDAQHGVRSLASILSGDYGVDLTGWSLFDATALSDDGSVVVGISLQAAGVGSRGFIAFLPEPSTALLLGAGLAGLAAAARRRRA